MRNLVLILTMALAAGACTSLPQGNEVSTVVVGTMPEPVTNNAVAALNGADGTTLYSFAGLASGKTWQDIHARGWAFDLQTQTAHQLADVPGDVGRLAATAIAIGSSIYFFGGYTVAEDGSEVSTPETFAYDPLSDTFHLRAPMPVPVDDAVAVGHLDRYIYLISGWHNSGNVNLVQVYDTEDNTWGQATPYPGAPVFGHAGGIVGTTMVIADGVQITNEPDGSRNFIMSDETWAGTISETDPTRIRWRPLPRHPGPPLYRMAATGAEDLNTIIFVGGSPNPYNFDGTGYDGSPSEPSTTLFGYDLGSETWQSLGTREWATMDHRGLLIVDGSFYTIGGMIEGQEVSPHVLRIELNNSIGEPLTR